MAVLNDPFKLPCGVIIKNRLVKAAMKERMADAHLKPTHHHNHLYKKWAQSGAGLLITGNVIIDHKHLESSGNVWFQDETMVPELKEWVASGTDYNTQLWVQISHAGRQTNIFNARHPKAPSAIKLKRLGLFGTPIAMSVKDIDQVVDGFVRTARISQLAGFTGIQIHAAHGYLLSQFLSPVTNQRTDLYGGSLDNRSRLLIRIIRDIRKNVGQEFPISVKLNSSDFQIGGFSEEDSLNVIRKLEAEKIDLLEISGGTYENVAFFLLNDEKDKLRESTKIREAYFLEFAQKVRKVSSLPLMITGGFRSRTFCNEVLKRGETDFIGMARPFLTNLEDIPAFLEGRKDRLDNEIVRTGIRKFDDAAEGGYYARLLIRLAKGLKKPQRMNAMWSSMFLILYEFKKAVLRKKLR
ncbi:NADH:flavin oxidoreductase/NADH oxidase family protein [Portibacter marinus]|uniref:NADH:flavin oxidoreductase/NADH oxidase family protein n=1 Tax=Portibacter marinus TaxID=2898660 RepID=UPI001F406EFF|nr:NADH:flavin oxidoreductase/NADH oxidase family protein [Portibacter marinus]